MDALPSQDRGGPYAAHSDHPDISAAPHFTPANPAHVSSPPPSDPTEHKPPDASSRGGTIKIILAATHPTPDHVNPSHWPRRSDQSYQADSHIAPADRNNPSNCHPTGQNGLPTCEKYSHLSSGFHTAGFSSRTGAVYMRAFQSAASASSSFLVILLRSHVSHFVSAFAELAGRAKRAECGNKGCELGGFGWGAMEGKG